MNSKIRRRRNTRTNKRRPKAIKRNTKTNKRKTYKRRTRKTIMKNKNKNNLGGKFNERQIQRIRNALIYYQDVEPFASDEEREDYIRKLNDISQLHALNFEAFYGNMIQHLDGLEDRTFRQWVDDVYEDQKERVETDNEMETDDDEDDEN